MTYLEAACNLNTTVEALSRHTPDGDGIHALAALATHTNEKNALIDSFAELLSSYNMKQFIPLSRRNQQSSAAMVFYAGDGIVAKITHDSCLTTELRPNNDKHIIYPYVIPPITSQRIGHYFVETFPLIDRLNISDQDVASVEKMLNEHNLTFKRKDDRLDNIGRLPNGKLAVLDADAVELLDPEKPATGMMDWLREVHNNFGDLYKKHKIKQEKPFPLVSENPDFKLVPLYTANIAPSTERPVGFLERLSTAYAKAPRFIP
ncbi:MAG: hypothetical protein EBR02_04830 [Alphaproteobacteria bacterium]|nr:hypothetical protein [Alphaproteobacteria bacterium]